MIAHIPFINPGDIKENKETRILCDPKERFTSTL